VLTVGLPYVSYTVPLTSPFAPVFCVRFSAAFHCIRLLNPFTVNAFGATNEDTSSPVYLACLDLLDLDLSSHNSRSIFCSAQLG
jgi:hypothetical protein